MSVAATDPFYALLRAAVFLLVRFVAAFRPADRLAVAAFFAGARFEARLVDLFGLSSAAASSSSAASSATASAAASSALATSPLRDFFAALTLASRAAMRSRTLAFW